MRLRTLTKLAGALVSLGLLALLLLWFAGTFAEKIEPGQVAAEVRRHAGEPTGRVHLVTERVMETAVGTIQASERTVVSSQILATVQEVRVRAGDTVEAGDVLVVLDDRDLQARVDQARQAAAAAEANALRAEADLERYRGLREQSVISQAEFDQVQSAALVARAELARARRAVDEAEISLTYAVIHSPITGRVVERLVEPGAHAVPGQPLLTLYNPNVLRLEAPVREALASTLRVGDRLMARIETLGLEVSGEIQEIVPQAEVGSRSFLVKVLLPEASGLYTGMFGRLLIPAGERQRLCLPVAALETIGQLEYADVLTPEGTVERRLVTTGQHSEFGLVEVLSGLASGETVLLKG